MFKRVLEKGGFEYWKKFLKICWLARYVAGAQHSVHFINEL